MQYQFPPDVEERIHARMASGQYDSEDDLFRAALDTLESVETEARELQTAIDAVKKGDAPVPLDDAFRALRQKHNLPTDV
jgi:Arc/MetJ-type ribon-helix-helix transcriptional regulator